MPVPDENSFPVLYRDRHLLVIDKPAGIDTVPDRQGSDSVVGRTGLMVCHRLDRGTSGVLVLGRSAAGHRLVNAAFAEGRVRKQYRAVVAGELADAGEVDLPIGPWKRGRVVVGVGRAARTRWTVRWREGGRAGVLAEPLTGRTHQIRAHLAAAGAPVVGDEDYGGPPADRLYLHAWRLTLPWPGRHDALLLEAPVPPGFDR